MSSWLVVILSNKEKYKVSSALRASVTLINTRIYNGIFYFIIFLFFLSFDGCRFSRKSISLTDRRCTAAVANDCEVCCTIIVTLVSGARLLAGFIMYFRHV